MSSGGIAPEIVPFAPALYVAWADGRLSPDEIRAVRDRARSVGGLDDVTRAALDTWLNPDQPPESADLRQLLDVMREAAPKLTADARRSLTDLGEGLAREQGSTEPAALRGALEAIERALGVAGGEAVRALLPDEPSRGTTPPARAFDPASLQRLLDGDHAALRKDVMDRIVTPELRPDPADEMDTATYRARTLERCRILADAGLGAVGFPSEFGGRDDVAGAIATFETLGFGDLSLLIKFGVQFGLFAGSIWQLGTRRHHERWLAPAARLDLPGCFAMTETGHGSNVRDIRTTATYEPASGSFIVHSPGREAWKDYIGNAANHGQAATVFAQLVVAGQEQGVHAFFVPIRDASGTPAPGVSIEDCGRKHGLNGVDNGRIAFDQVRVPRDYLLDRFGGVRPDGTYHSAIASPTRRFFTMLGTLVAGRVSIAAASLSAAKTGLAVAVRYTDGRRQFGPEGEPEVPVLDYLTMQRRLMPRLATAVALDFGLQDLVRTYAGRAGRPSQEIEAQAAGFKAFASTFAVETLDACRQACGGRGYLSSTRLPALIDDTDIFTTFEGANTVLLQLVTKGLLSGYREQFGELNLWGVARYVGARAASVLAELNPVASRRTEPAHLRDPAFHAAAVRWREDRLLTTLARRLKRRMDEGEDSFAALNACQDHAVELARAHVDRLLLESLHAGVQRCDDGALRPVLDRLSALHGLARIEADIGWYLEKGWIESSKAGAIRTEVNRLCAELRPDAVTVTEGFGIADALVPDLR